MRFGLHYMLSSPTGRWVESYTECLNQIVVAESCGFESVLVAEHHFKTEGVVPTPFLVCAAIAAQTKRMRIGPGVVLLPLHHVVDIAEQTCVLDVLSNGRAVLGVGMGNTPEEFMGFGVPMAQRARRMEESLSCLRELLGGTKVTFKGSFYSFQNITLTPRPVQKPHPPIWVGAEKSEAAISRAARYGDAWVIPPHIPQSLLSKYISLYNETLRTEGRETQSISRPMRKDVYITKNGDQAWTEAEKGVINQYYNGYLKWGGIVDDDGRPLRFDDISKDDFMEIVRKRIIVGEPETLIQEAERLRSEYGITDLILRIQFPGLEYNKTLDAIRLIGEEVIPHLDDQS